MKTKNSQLNLPLICALCFSFGFRSAVAGETNQGANVAAPDDFGYDFREGKTNKIARVYSVTPTHVQVIYEGGQGGRNIPRQSLPPALQSKYPYDAEKAAEYQRQQAEAAAHQVAAQQAAYRVAAQHRENEIKAEIEKLEHQVAGALNSLAVTLRKQGKLAEAASVFREAADQGNIWDQIRLARMYAKGDDIPKDAAEAAKWYRKAIENEDRYQLNRVAWMMATSANPDLRDGTNAVAFAEKAVNEKKLKVPAILAARLDTLAAAYAETGQFEKAVRVQKEAIALLSEQAEKDDYSSRLRLFESNTPYHKKD